MAATLLTGSESFQDCETFRGQDVILPRLGLPEADALINALTYFGVRSIGLKGSVRRVVPDGEKAYLLPNFGWVVYAALEGKGVDAEYCTCPSGTTGPFGPWIDWKTKRIVHNGPMSPGFRVHAARMARIEVGAQVP